MASLSSGLAACLLLAAGARADVLHVPAEFSTIQEAVNAAVADDEIVVAAGSYDEQVVIAGKTGLTLRGQGQVVLTGGQALVASLLVDSSTGIRVEHLRFEGVLGDAIALTDSSDITIEHCRVDESEGAGVRITECDLVDLEKVIVAGTQDHGLRATGCSLLTVHKGSVSDTDQDSVSIEGCQSIVVDHVTVEGINESGIALVNVSSAVVRKCLVRDPTFSAISITGSDVLVEGNRMLDVAANAGGLFSTATGCVIRGNRVVGASFAYNVGGAQVQLLDNRSIKSGMLGLGLGGTFPLVVSGNRVLKGTGTGIQVAGADFSVLMDNKVGATTVGFSFGADDVQALDNRASGAAQDGFRVHGIGCVLVRNQAHGSGDFDLFDDSSGGTTYVDNDFGTTHFE